MNCTKLRIIKQSINIVKDPIEDHRQLAFSVHRMTHRCFFKVEKDLFWVYRSLTIKTFNKVARVEVLCLHNKFCYLLGYGKE